MDNITDPATAFDRVYCINLDRRPDRWRRFAEGLPADWPFPTPMRVPAIDGKLVKHPPHWSPGGGAWGCYRSHLRIIEQCLNEGVQSVLLLEDDALFPPDFAARVLAWLRHVPANWQMLYLGGQHLFPGQHPPLKLAPQLFQPYNVNRTHAFALQGDMLRIVYHHLLRTDWHRANHIDHHLGRLHQQRKHRIYCPPEWLVGQASGKSNISGREPPDRFWKPAAEIAVAQPTLPPPTFVAIVGTHSSGSSAVAQALWHLGVWFGAPDQLIGYWGKHLPARGGEHKQLAKILEKTAPLSAVAHAKRPKWIRRQLAPFVAQLTQQAGGRLPAIKYPQLSVCGQPLRKITGPGLRVIVCQRPLEESIASLQRRIKSPPTAEQLDAHQRWLAAGHADIARAMPRRTWTIQYAELLADPRSTMERTAAWLGLQPTAEQLAAAVAAVKPELQHVKGAA
jgi:hypothetical protein